MLQSLHIRNFAIIEDVALEFGPGLNVLTGETGAGKSIIIQALSLLMGQRGSSEWIRKDEASAVVTGLFNVSDRPDLLKKIDEWGVPLDEPELLVQRTLARSGRNQVRLNGMPATVAMLAELAERLVDIVSQKEHEMLLRSEVQRDLLDQFGGLEKTRQAYRDSLEKLHHLQQERAALEEGDRSNREMEEFLRFQAKEIKEAQLHAGEDEELKTEKSRIKNAAHLGELCTLAETLLVSGDDTVTGRLAQLEQQLARVSDDDAQLAELLVVLQSVQAQLADVARTFTNNLQELNFEPGRLEAIESRLAEIDRLKRKYGASVEEVLLFAEEVTSKLEGLENFEERAVELRQACEEGEQELVALDKKLQEARRKVAKRLAKEVVKELTDLGMEQAVFEVAWEAVANGLLTAHGKQYDRLGSQRAVFNLVANPGEDPKPLVRIASGGERSRILLAIKKILVDFADLATSIYDEVDEGVGGATASKIGEKLAEIAKQRQVICITHQAQIAAFASAHFVIHKEFGDARTQTCVRRLEQDEHELELARMLAGKKVTAQAREHARELIRSAGA